MKNLNGTENVLDPNVIYSGDNGRLFCGRHAGHSARMTGIDLNGLPVLPVSSDELEWISGDPAHPAGCETCGDQALRSRAAAVAPPIVVRWIRQTADVTDGTSCVSWHASCGVRKSLIVQDDVDGRCFWAVYRGNREYTGNSKNLRAAKTAAAALLTDKGGAA